MVSARSANANNGRGSIIALSETGTDFVQLPPLDRLERLPNRTIYERIDCLDADGEVKRPSGTETGLVIVEGRLDTQGAALVLLHNCQQALKPVFCRITDKFGILVAERKFTVVDFEPKADGFILHLVDQS